MLAVNRPISAG